MTGRSSRTLQLRPPVRQENGPVRQLPRALASDAPLVPADWKRKAALQQQLVAVGGGYIAFGAAELNAAQRVAR